MAKKMTKKEFKEIFERGYNFDVYGWEGILNLLIIAERQNADEADRLGCSNAAKSIRNRAHIWYKELDARGYYNTTEED